MDSGEKGRGMGPSAIGQIAVPVEDVDRATTFYKEVLGLKHLFSAPPGLAFFDCGGVRLMLSRPEGEGSSGPPGSILYYRVPDIGGMHERLVAQDTSVVGEPHVVHKTESMELWMGFYGDTEGNVFATMDEREVSST